jgi:predicted phage baseplate assembly protein
VTVEEEDWRPPLLRFRTGVQGTDPPDGSVLRAVYEAGGGVRANLPANALTVVERNTAVAGQTPDWQPVSDDVSPRNVVAASGGTDVEPLHRVRRAAPHAFAVNAERAVLPSDHAAAARALPGIDRASATREWTGAWPLIRTVVDLLGAEQAADLGAADLEAARRHLDGLRMIGQEAAVVAGLGVGLVIGLDVCLVPGTDAEATRRAILARLRPGTNEAPGLFHPDNLRLGGTVHTSAILAATAAVVGVDAVEVTTARRLVEPEGTVHTVLVFAQNEIPVLDDDPARPERGRIEITLRGGR